MRLQILTLLCYLSVLVLATGKLEDKSNIEDLENALILVVDDKEYVKASQLFTPNATFDPGPGAFQPFEGRPAIADFYRKSIHNITRFGQLTTQLIKFYPPFDKEERSDRASAVSYYTLTFFGAGNSTDVYIVFIKVVDKIIVRTKEPGFGGGELTRESLNLLENLSETPPSWENRGSLRPSSSCMLAGEQRFQHCNWMTAVKKFDWGMWYRSRP